MSNTMTMHVDYLGPEGSTANTNIHFTTEVGLFDAATVTAINDLWNDFFEAFANDQWTSLGALRFTSPAIDPTEELFSTSIGVTGSGGGDPGPLQACILVHLSAGLGRRKNGRWYLPGASEAISSGSRIDSTSLGAITDAFVTFNVACFVDTDWFIGVRSLADGVVRPLTGGKVVENLMTQRRRVERVQYA